MGSEIKMGRLMAAAGILLLFVAVIFGALASPVYAQGPGGNGINAPQSGQTINGIISVIGTATDASFLRYELAFFPEANPGAGWIVFAQGDQQVQNGVLAIWDTTVGRETLQPIFPDGTYRLRLRVVRQDSNYDAYFASNLRLANDEFGPTETPTITPTDSALTPEATGTVAPEATAIGPLATFTPFSTPPPISGAKEVDLGRPDDEPLSPADEEGGLLGRIGELFDAERLGGAFWKGVRYTFAIFTLFGGYLLVRNVLRGNWRPLWERLKSLRQARS